MNALILKSVKQKTKLFTTVECHLMPKGVIKKGETFVFYTSNHQKLFEGKVFGLMHNKRTSRIVTNTNNSKTILVDVLFTFGKEVNLSTVTFLLNKTLVLNENHKKSLKKFSSFLNLEIKDIIKNKTLPKDVIIRELDKQIWKPKENRIGMTLQGGGLKGSFGVGAIHFLSKSGILNADRALSLSSASTGSITSLLLAQRQESAYEDALKQYWEISNISGMLELTDQVKAILRREPLVKDTIKEYLRTGGLNIGAASDQAIERFISDPLKEYGNLGLAATAGGTGAGIGFAVGGPIGAAIGGTLGAVGGFFGGFLLNSLDEIEKFTEAIKCLHEQNSIADITPVREKLEAITNVNAIKAAKTEMRMAITSLRTHITAYITEKGELLYPKLIGDNEGYSHLEFNKYKITSVNDTANVRSNFLIESALTSGAFPGLFKPVAITYEKTIASSDGIISSTPVTEIFYDGGVRENMPFKILTQQTKENNISDLKSIIGIYCEPSTHNHRSESQFDTNKYPNLSEIFLHSMQTINYESSVNDLYFGKPLNLRNLDVKRNTTPNVLHIAPGIVPIGLTEAVPFYLRCSVWYGYLRAFDECFIAQNFTKANIQKLNEAGISRGQIRNNTDEIFLMMRSLYTLGAKIINTSNYAGYGTVSKQKGLEFSELKNIPVNIDFFSDRELNMNKYKGIKTIIFDSKSCYLYFKAKIKLIELLLARKNNFDAIFEKDFTKLFFNPDHYASYFFYGDFGFMKKCFFGQWWGLKSYIMYTQRRNVVRYNIARLLVTKYKNILEHKDFSKEEFDWLSNDRFKNDAKNVINDYIKLVKDHKGILNLLEGNFEDNIDKGLPYGAEDTLLIFNNNEFGDAFTHVTDDFYK